MADQRHARRRQEDRDQMLNERLEQLEKETRALSTTVSQIQNDLNSAKQEHTHTRELLGMQLKSLDIAVNKISDSLVHVVKEISGISSDESKSPVTRRLQEDLASCHKTLSGLDEWRNQVNGVLTVIKWLGPVGLVAVTVALWQAFSK